jgi:hypothetical protein
VPSENDVDDRTRTNRLLVAYLVVYVALSVALTVTYGMTRSPLSLLLLAVIIGTTAVLGAVLLRVIGGPEWRRLASAIRQHYRSAGFDLPSTVCSFLTILIVVMAGSQVKGNLPALLLGGIVAAAPLVVLTAARRQWS